VQIKTHNILCYGVSKECARARAVKPEDRNAKDSELAPAGGCSHRAPRKDSLPRPKNNSHRMNGKVYSSSMIASNDLRLPL
jgi:hypothetical protein